MRRPNQARVELEPRVFVAATNDAADYHDVYHIPARETDGEMVKLTGAACGATPKEWRTVLVYPGQAAPGRQKCERCMDTYSSWYFKTEHVVAQAWRFSDEGPNT